MEPEILKFDDILRGIVKRWRVTFVFFLLTTILSMIVLIGSDNKVDYQGNFKALIKSEIVTNENGVVSKKDPNLVQNIIEVMKTRDFVDNVLKRSNLKLTSKEVLENISIVNIDRTDFLQIKYSSKNKEQTTRVIFAIKDELLDVFNNYSDDGSISIEEEIGVIEKVEGRNEKLLILIGLIGGISLGVALSFVLECINKTFKTKGELYRELRMPIIANIPKVSKKSSKMILGNTVDVHFKNAFNSLASEIKYGKNNERVKSIAVTSSISGEGSTTLAINLALALSNSNKVLLIDANYENNEMLKVLGLGQGLGFKDVIFSEEKLEKAITNKFKNLDVLTIGESDLEVSSLIDSKEFEELLGELSDKYDYIILDTPALQASPTVKILLKKVDANMLVVKAESTKKDVVKESIKDIESLGVNLIGISFNFGDKFRNIYYSYKNN